VKFPSFGFPLALAFVLVSGFAHPAAAQNMTTADVDRLQASIVDASRDISQLQARDATLAGQLQRELESLQEESVYLKVKLQKNEAVPRSDYFDLRDRIDAVRAKARGSAPATSSRSTTSPAAKADIPVGTELDVRLQQSLSSETAAVEDRFEATTLVDLKEGERVMIPAGSVMRGVVSSVNKAGRLDRKGSLTLAFDQVTIDNRAYPIRGTVTQALESEGVRGEAGKIGAGAGIGAIIGGILGGFKGAMAGILIGGGGTVAATDGKDVNLPAGTVLRVRLDSGLDVR